MGRVDSGVGGGGGGGGEGGGGGRGVGGVGAVLKCPDVPSPLPVQPPPRSGLSARVCLSSGGRSTTRALLERM